LPISGKYTINIWRCWNWVRDAAGDGGQN